MAVVCSGNLVAMRPAVAIKGVRGLRSSLTLVRLSLVGSGHRCGRLGECNVGHHKCLVILGEGVIALNELGERGALAGGNTGWVVKLPIEAVNGAGGQVVAGGASSHCCIRPSMGGGSSTKGKGPSHLDISEGLPVLGVTDIVL